MSTTDTTSPTPPHTATCESPCPGKELCGSCPWSTTPYPLQLQMKLAAINTAFQETGVAAECSEILPSPAISHYRNRMDFAIDFEGRIGLREKGKWWRVIDNHHCFISDERIEQAFGRVREWIQSADLSYFDRKKHHGLLRYAVIRATLTGQLMLNLVTSVPRDRDEEQRARAALHTLTSSLSATTVIWARNNTISDVSFGTEMEIISGPGVIEEEVEGVKFQISPNAFFQTNSRGAAVLLREVFDNLSLSGSQGTLLDLFCGSGFFSVACASRMQRCVGVELVADAVRDARINAELNHVPVEFHDMQAEKFDWSSLTPAMVIVDPPRAGLHPKALKALLDNAPPSIIYVSCNFGAFARELRELLTAYNIVRCRAVDLFPQTPHVEVVTLLQHR